MRATRPWTEGVVALATENGEIGVSTRLEGPFRLSPQATDVDLLAKYFRGFGDPTRLRILNLLRHEERSVGELVAALEQPQPKVSNHLACLRWCGFVVAERRGKRVFYRLADDRVAQIVDLTKGLLADNEEHAARFKLRAI
jgi:ArsR family transcriptional regulator, cadmium/lead-responsive transcriptional repressor